jgi:hypothetical protein
MLHYKWWSVKAWRRRGALGAAEKKRSRRAQKIAALAVTLATSYGSKRGVGR